MRTAQISKLKTFGSRLGWTREGFGRRAGRPGITRLEFAAILGVDGDAYCKLEEGATNPSLATLTKIRAVTGLGLDWLISGDDEPRYAFAKWPPPEWPR